MAASMLQNNFSKISLFSTRLSNLQSCMGVTAPCMQQVRWKNRNKHYVPKWRRHRWAKTLKVDLPDMEEIRRLKDLSPKESREKLKEEGKTMPRPYFEGKVLVASSTDIFEPFEPPEGDGKASVLSSGINLNPKNTAKAIDNKRKSFMDSRKIRKYDEDFRVKHFGEIAKDIYIEVYDALNNFKENEEKLHDLVTEKAFPDMTVGLNKMTVRWKFYESIEPARVVQVRCSHLTDKTDLFGQVTVRLHTKQTLALYDRFGRLMFGSEDLIKDCLEYVVFEKFITDENGRWRLHAKIPVKSVAQSHPVIRTLKKPNFTEDEEEDKKMATA